MSKNNYILSVIIAFVANDEKYLTKCIESIEVSANFAEIKTEFILVANGVNFVREEYSTNHKVIKNKYNLGFGQAINQGLKNARGDWCLIICPDVIVKKFSIKYLLNHISRKKIALIVPQIILSNGTLQQTILSFPSLWEIFIEQSYFYKMMPFLFKSPLSETKTYSYPHYIKGSAAICWLIKRDIFLQLDGFDKRFFLYFEDVDLCKRIQELGYKIIFEPKAKVTHLEHKSSGGVINGKIYTESIHIYLKKYYNKNYSFFCLLFFSLGCLTRLIYWNTKILFHSNENDLRLSRKKVLFCKSSLIGSFRLLKEYIL